MQEIEAAVRKYHFFARSLGLGSYPLEVFDGLKFFRHVQRVTFPLLDFNDAGSFFPIRSGCNFSKFRYRR